MTDLILLSHNLLHSGQINQFPFATFVNGNPVYSIADQFFGQPEHEDLDHLTLGCLMAVVFTHLQNKEKQGDYVSEKIQYFKHFNPAYKQISLQLETSANVSLTKQQKVIMETVFLLSSKTLDMNYKNNEFYSKNNLINYQIIPDISIINQLKQIKNDKQQIFITQLEQLEEKQEIQDFIHNEIFQTQNIQKVIDFQNYNYANVANQLQKINLSNFDEQTSQKNFKLIRQNVQKLQLQNCQFSNMLSYKLPQFSFQNSVVVQLFRNEEKPTENYAEIKQKNTKRKQINLLLNQESCISVGINNFFKLITDGYAEKQNCSLHRQYKNFQQSLELQQQNHTSEIQKYLNQNNSYIKSIYFDQATDSIVFRYKNQKVCISSYSLDGDQTKCKLLEQKSDNQCYNVFLLQGLQSDYNVLQQVDTNNLYNKKYYLQFHQQNDYINDEIMRDEKVLKFYIQDDNMKKDQNYKALHNFWQFINQLINE